MSFRPRIAIALVAFLILTAPTALADQPAPTREGIRAEVEAQLGDQPVVTREMVREELDRWTKSRENETFRAYWKFGPKLEAFGGKLKMGFHGRIMIDWTSFLSADENLEAATGAEFHSGVNFRRVWTNVVGQVGPYVDFMCQLSWIGERDIVAPLDVWVRFKDLNKCWGCLFPDIKLGHFQEPIGLAWLTSSKFFTMTAWPLPTTTFTPGYNTGAMLNRNGWGDRVTAKVAVLGANSGIEGRQEWDDGTAVTGRFTALPWAPCDCDCRVFHVGVGCSYRFGLQEVRFRSRPDLDFGPYVIDTGYYDANEEIFVDVETALVYDRFTVQAEYMWVRVDADTGTDPTYWGAYVQGSYFLNGPCRNFRKRTATFTGFSPCKDFDCTQSGHTGTWVVAARYGYVDTDDGDKSGGRASDMVLGVNWWLNPNTRIMLNYVHSNAWNAHGSRLAPISDGSLNAIVVRFQVHW